MNHTSRKKQSTINFAYTFTEGSPCRLHDGSRGICKNIAYCESIKEGLRTGILGYHNIVGCSFEVRNRHKPFFVDSFQ